MFRVYVSEVAEVEFTSGTNLDNIPCMHEFRFYNWFILSSLLPRKKSPKIRTSFKYPWDRWLGNHQGYFISGFIVTFQGTYERQLSGDNLCIAFNHIPPTGTVQPTASQSPRKLWNGAVLRVKLGSIVVFT